MRIFNSLFHRPRGKRKTNGTPEKPFKGNIDDIKVGLSLVFCDNCDKTAINMLALEPLKVAWRTVFFDIFLLQFFKYLRLSEKGM